MDSLLQILLFGGFIFIMMRFGCGSHMFGGGHGKGGHGKGGHGKGGHGEGKQAGGCCGGGGKKHSDTPSDKIQDQPAPPKECADPVCGKTVLTNGSRTSFHDGLVYYFCSSECREAFEAAPLQYLNQGSETPTPRLEQLPMENGGR